jgi:O-antigen/teichoic acid export membrane protein
MGMLTAWTQWDAWIVGVLLLVAALVTRWLAGRDYRRGDRRAFRIGVLAAVALTALAGWILAPWADHGDGPPGIWSALAAVSVAWYAADAWRHTRGLPPLGGWLLPGRGRK